ncbi:Crossover junction endonuclease EME1 [Spathaspora sp. JA1]|nr:Crossover junction endonuclease EME1 [Spathaspora sp. JA1]
MSQIEIITLSSSDESDEVIEIDSSTELPETSELLHSHIPKPRLSSDIPLTPQHRSHVSQTVTTDVPRFAIPSSPPILISSPYRSRQTKNDSIVDSSFSFSKSKPVKENMLDLVHWLSSDSEEEGPLLSQPKERTPKLIDPDFEFLAKCKQVFTSSDPNQPREQESASQPARRSPKHQVLSQPAMPKESVEPRTSPEKVKPKRSKKKQKEEHVIDLPQIDGFKYTQKDLVNANKVTKTKEQLYQEMEIHIETSTYNSFNDILDNFACKTQPQPAYRQPIISWHRNITSQYDSTKDIFIPCHPTTVVESVIGLYYLADTFITKLNDNSLTSDVITAKTNLGTGPNTHVIIIVEGFDQLLSKIRAFEQRQFKNQVLERFQPEAQPSKPKKKKEVDYSNYPEASHIQHLINKVQVELQTNIFMVRTRLEAITWLNSFTYTIANSLYDKYERNKQLANLGYVRSGTDVQTTFLKSIQQFNLMTQVKADKLYTRYKTMNQLYTKLQLSGTLGQDNMGKNIVPPTVDSTLFKFFTSDDPNDIIK